MNGVQVSVQVYSKGLRPNIPEYCPKEYAQLIRECWDTDPTKRPSFQDIVKRLEAMLGDATSIAAVQLPN